MNFNYSKIKPAKDEILHKKFYDKMLHIMYILFPNIIRIIIILNHIIQE